jgi:hypothetical protein
MVSNIGITPDLSSIYTSNSAMDNAFVQVSLFLADFSCGGFLPLWIARVHSRQQEPSGNSDCHRVSNHQNQNPADYL